MAVMKSPCSLDAVEGSIEHACATCDHYVDGWDGWHRTRCGLCWMKWQERVRGSLIKAAERLAQSIITPSTVEGSAYGAAWPRFADGAPVVIGDCVKGVMCDVEVASIVFRADCIVLYDSQMFHYVKLDGGEKAQRPDGTRLALD